MARRKPNQVLELQGTKRKDRHSAQTDGSFDPCYPDPPDYLTDKQLEIWHFVKECMEPANLYTKSDASKLARYCVMEIEWRTMLTEFPATKLAQLRSLEKDLYLDPEMRQKLGLAKSKPQNAFDKFKTA